MAPNNEDERGPQAYRSGYRQLFQTTSFVTSMNPAETFSVTECL